MTTAPATRSAPAAKPVAAAVQRENVSRDDPIAERIAATQRVATVQRALSEFGYGQIKPTGVAGPDTQAAIEKFERERMMPVTGKISARMLRELSAITGRVFD
jgi:peptidoglycan hydrolase-like protein with peptidoglycan-binding domain